MRICQVIESSSGGSVQVALALTKGLVDAGDDVTFIYSPVRADAAFTDQLTHHPTVTFVPVAMQRKVGVWDLLAALRLWIALSDYGPFDVIHAHSSKAGGLVRLLRWLLPRRSCLVYTPHAFMTMAQDASRVYGDIERLLSVNCDAIVAVSVGEREHAVQALRIAPERIHVIPNGIDYTNVLPKTAARELLGFEPDDVVVGFVGRFVPQKNAGRLIEAFGLAAQEIPSLRLAIVGGGEGQAALEAEIVRRGLKDKVRLWIDQQARPLIAGFDVLACSSDYEGISLVFLEALTAGVPILTTPVAGAAETVVEGESGFVATGFSASALAASLVRWASLSAEEKAQMGRAAQEKSKDFSLGAMVQAYRRLYETLTQNRTR